MYKSIIFMCECESGCTLKATVSDEHLEQYLALFGQPKNEVDFIVDGCKQGPMPGATLLTKGEGYSLYQNQEEN